MQIRVARRVNLAQQGSGSRSGSVWRVGGQSYAPGLLGPTAKLFLAKGGETVLLNRRTCLGHQTLVVG